ncbi:two-component SAPR family response regulator [Paenibacillus sp. DS2015]|uniref:response regulator n=1 Tax=Paenibacillus sp. DS2015 TaxID=3373917 RepID=UPI003D1AADE3
MKVILVDDEQLAIDYLERQLMKLTDIEVIGKFIDPIIGREEILLKEVDLVFLDISLPEISGIELAEQLLEQKPDLNIVFVTAYNEYAVKAFELNAVDYIVKPVGADRLTKTIDRISERVESKQVETEIETLTLRMNIFRQVTVEVSNRHFSVIQWRTAKAQELFLYLLQHRGQLVRKSVLIDMLWPEHEPDKVYSQLYTAIYHIRKTLTSYGGHFQIVNSMENYVLTIEDVQLDVEEWETKLASSPPLSADTIDDYIEIMKLYTGNYLQEYDYWWAESERQRLKELWLSISYGIADWYEEQGQMEESIFWYIEICVQHVQEEKAHFALMKIYARMDNYILVNRQYSSLIATLLDEFNEPPSAYITEWYEQWLVRQGSN